MLFDSHAHLNDARFNIDRRYVLNALKKTASVLLSVRVTISKVPSLR